MYLADVSTFKSQRFHHSCGLCRGWRICACCRLLQTAESYKHHSTPRNAIFSSDQTWTKKGLASPRTPVSGAFALTAGAFHNEGFDIGLASPCKSVSRVHLRWSFDNEGLEMLTEYTVKTTLICPASRVLSSSYMYWSNNMHVEFPLRSVCPVILGIVYIRPNEEFVVCLRHNIDQDR
jgi:hypothetical protein